MSFQVFRYIRDARRKIGREERKECVSQVCGQLRLKLEDGSTSASAIVTDKTHLEAFEGRWGARTLDRHLANLKLQVTQQLIDQHVRTVLDAEVRRGKLLHLKVTVAVTAGLVSSSTLHNGDAQTT